MRAGSGSDGGDQVTGFSGADVKFTGDAMVSIDLQLGQ
jgi:hypothetical protein